MIMNGLLITVLIKGHRTYKKSSFYIIVWQHITCDQLTQLIQFIVAVPITYAGAPIYGQTWWLYGFSLFDTIAYNAKRKEFNTYGV
uniref:Uncharacterized protein n=1 Tax=Acrobeloides nanus TaxID=290746 RepID=A0A914DAU5_9BILA